MKTLLLDIETAPHLAYVWSCWRQNISMDKIVDNGHVLCFTAKWFGEREVEFARTEGTTRSMTRMLKRAHDLIDEADAVVHYNGKSFDIPTLNREFLIREMAPPAPYKQIDLLEVVRDRFNFPINKMDYVCQRLGIPGKVKHAGFKMWIDCMDQDRKAWETMEAYNRHDVVMLERLYERVRPWIRNHPNVAAFDGRPSACPSCGAEGTLQARGVAVTRDAKYPRFQCAGEHGCGSWCRGKEQLKPKTKTTFQGIS